MAEAAANNNGETFKMGHIPEVLVSRATQDKITAVTEELGQKSGLLSKITSFFKSKPKEGAALAGFDASSFDAAAEASANHAAAAKSATIKFSEQASEALASNKTEISDEVKEKAAGALKGKGGIIAGSAVAAHGAVGIVKNIKKDEQGKRHLGKAFLRVAETAAGVAFTVASHRGLKLGDLAKGAGKEAPAAVRA